MKMRAYMFVLAIFAVMLIGAISQVLDEEISERCVTALTCGECIRTSPLCSWCGSENFNRGEARCDILKNLEKRCPEKDISNPKFKMTVNKDDAWTSGVNGTPPVQVKPQALEINLRPNEPVAFKLKFKQEENYPVDLYFLLDLSYGMVRQKEAQQRLIELGLDIPKSMLNITTNFRLGFGTFVDKVLMPYSAWTDAMLQNRCPFEGKKCRPPHDFKNHVNLGDDAPNFATKMKEALEDISQSLDDAEGGLDALIQALDCEIIGWRSVSRRIIVYSSNSLFHIAGYGKLGGATRQNDLKCALGSDGVYLHDKIYDYPSVSQVASKLREKKANVIFAVMSNVTSHYEQLKHYLSGAVVGALAEDSTNIVNLIRDSYYELRSIITFQATNADNVIVVFKSKCLGDIVRETNHCEGLEINTNVEFDVTMTATSDICIGKSGVVSRVVTLDAVGLKEQLHVKLNVQCDCECEGADQEEVNSAKCSLGNGTYECGMCNCNPHRYGRKCECDESQISSDKSLEQCKMDKNDTDAAVCSDRGECICGQCVCFPLGTNPNEKFSGEYCQCNDFNCPAGSRGLCGGSSRGTCKCGKCNCLSGWTGDDCECTTDNTSCVATNGQICNGFGTCNCGKCICTQQKVGHTCEDCLTCTPQCSEYIDCAQCKAFGTGKYDKDKCESECQKWTISVVDTLEDKKGVRQCEGIDVDSCTFFFTYEYTPDNDVIIKVQETKDCPAEAPVTAIVGGTVAAVVLIPLLIICLIIFIRNRRDAKEYADFMKDRERAKWDSGANPIYKDPKSTFQNPTYKGQ